MKHLFIYCALLLILGLGFYSCDDVTSPQNTLEGPPTITNFFINPDTASFRSQQDGFKDTTVTVTLNSYVKNWTENSTFAYTLTNKSTNSIEQDGELEPASEIPEGHLFTTDLLVETTTTSIENYIINVIVKNSTGNGNYAQTIFNINGFSNSHPEILVTNSPGEITRPSEGSINAIFTAKVTDDDGQQTIDQVLIRVIDPESGNDVTGSPFQMYDNGETYDDEVAGDSTYTWAQEITPAQENPNRDFDIEFYVLDSAGLSSDTVRTTFRIRE